MICENPTSLIERVFARIAGTRMAGLPMNNLALRVEACGFRLWQGVWVGVLVTPWTINLLLLPGGNAAFRRLGSDERQRWTFPSGDYDLMGTEEGELGAYQSLSLFSPAFEFASHDAARQAAGAALEALWAPQESAVAERREAARLEGRSLQDRPLSRRAFLGGFLPHRAQV